MSNIRQFVHSRTSDDCMSDISSVCIFVEEICKCVDMLKFHKNNGGTGLSNVYKPFLPRDALSASAVLLS